MTRGAKNFSGGSNQAMPAIAGGNVAGVSETAAKASGAFLVAALSRSGGWYQAMLTICAAGGNGANELGDSTFWRGFATPRSSSASNHPIAAGSGGTTIVGGISARGSADPHLRSGGSNHAMPEIGV